jgi:hypothetical protein
MSAMRSPPTPRSALGRALARLVLALALAAVPTAFAPPAHAEGATHESSVTAAPDALVTVRVTDCTVRVVGSARRDVHVSGTSEDVRTTSDGTHVQVDVHPGPGSLQIDVPAGAHVEVHGVGASVSVKGVSGPVVARTVNGDVEVDAAARDVEARSVSGRVDVTIPRGDVRASAVSGAVAVRVPGGGTVAAKTVSGNVRVGGGPLTRLEAQAVSGNLELEVRLDGSGPFEARTHSGNVHVVLPKGDATTVDARSYRGTVDGADGGTPPPPGGRPRPVLSVSTFAGNVTVERK